MATTTKLRMPSIPVRTPKNRFQSEQDDLVNKIGQRVTIPSLGNTTGFLRYVGEPDFKAGVWAGIELDKQGEGKNDGSVQGKVYFNCAPNTGIFIKLNKIVIHPPSPPLPPVQKQIKPTPTMSTTRKSNLPLTRPSKTKITSSSSPTTTTATTATATSSSSTNKKRTLTGLRNSSVPTTSSAATSPSPTTATKRSTLTPTTTATTMSPTPPPVMTRKKSTPSPATPPPLPPTPSIEEQNKVKEETNQLYDILEKVQRERDSLLLQMKNKETAWERLVSSKESLSVQVEEKEYKSQRLQRELEEQKVQLEQLQYGLAERDASLAKNQRDDEKASQDQRRIDRLETLVRELQATIKTSQEETIQRAREHQGAIEQVRREVSASEAMTASLEKECEELRRAGLEAIHAYENSVVQLTEKHAQELQQKDRHISQLDYTIADLRHKQSTLFDDDEDIDSRLKQLSQPSERNRLVEEQLELTMAELDSERLTIQSLRNELDAMKQELGQARNQVIAVEQKYQQLTKDYEKELDEKRKLIEDADHAFEQQAKVEDEHYQMKLSKLQLEKEFNQLVETHKQLETEYNQLMDEMLALEKQDLSGEKKVESKVVGNNAADTAKIQSLEKELQLKATQVRQLSKDLAELETLVENRVFGESELEEQLEAERKRVASLERELKELRTANSNKRDSFKSLLISPTTTTTTSGNSPTPTEENLQKYCELCERYGHDLLQCKSASSFTDNGKMYCDNCDDFGDHTTEDCPNGDETF